MVDSTTKKYDHVTEMKNNNFESYIIRQIKIKRKHTHPHTHSHTFKIKVSKRNRNMATGLAHSPGTHLTRSECLVITPIRRKYEILWYNYRINSQPKTLYYSIVAQTKKWDPSQNTLIFLKGNYRGNKYQFYSPELGLLLCSCY